ncbi:hypothetical protein VMCG_02112 [Cytospora schulzeri]|uniref:GPI inositol-deacylase winged helix domain-containing protein n=1 Tax=Cytospora schulzeri TaxID=448051 RepID=A0A423X2N4_9PEZI|nr:hypothetical protein VMCG_02112 [Valsa malicola]
MDRINGQGGYKRQLAIDALIWLVFSMRTLSFSEIQHALAVEPLDKLFHNGRLVAAEMLTAACAGFVLVDLDADVIRLAHYTAAEYLREKRASMFRDCQSKLAEQCLTYLSFDEFGETTRGLDPRQMEQRNKAYPFLNYAADHWGHHIAQGVKEGFVHKLAWEFLSNAGKVESARRAMTEISFQHETQISGLHIAAYFGLDTVVKKAISKNKAFPLNAKTSRDQTPLHWAANFDQVKFIKLLVEKGVDLNETDIEGKTALHHAVMHGHLSAVEMLLSSVRLPNLDITDCHGWTPLRWAARYGPGKTVELLLENGASVDAQDANGWTALRWAAYSGQKWIVEQLVQYGASLERRSAQEHWTLLHWAAREGLDNIIQMLIEKGVPLDSVDGEGYTALRGAIDYGRGKTAWLLMTAGADVNMADGKGNTPLHSAVNLYNKSQDNSLAWLLLEYRANINARNKLGLTPLHIAATVGYGSILWLLLEKGADTTKVDNNGRTPLHWAVTEWHQEIPKLLLARAENLLNVKDDQRQTALHVAASDGNLAMP